MRRIQKSRLENSWDPVREQEVMQNIGGECGGDKWGSRSTGKTQSSMGRLPSPPLSY